MQIDRTPIRTLASLAAGSALLAVTATAAGQALTTASRSAEITGFVGYSNSNTDYSSTYRDAGYTVGGNYIFYPGHWLIHPAVEARYVSVTGPVVDQSAFMGGLEARISSFHDRVQPYAAILFGAGNMKYHFLPVPTDPTYTKDNSTNLSYGAGVDYVLSGPYRLKADFQYGNWNFGKNLNLTPSILTIGFEYRIPFHSEVGGREHRVREDKTPSRPVGPPSPPTPQSTAPIPSQTDQAPEQQAGQTAPTTN